MAGRGAGMTPRQPKAPQRDKSKVAVTDYAFDDLDVETAILGPLGCRVVGQKTGKDPAALSALVADADYVITQFAPVDAGIIGAMQKCRIIVRYGIGVDNVDLQAAAGRGIPVCNVPDYCTDEVADHTLAMILDLTRRITTNALKVRSGVWGLGVRFDYAGEDRTSDCLAQHRRNSEEPTFGHELNRYRLAVSVEIGVRGKNGHSVVDRLSAYQEINMRALDSAGPAAVEELGCNIMVRRGCEKEGEAFEYNSSFGSYEQAVGMWNTLFDYIDEKSAVVGFTIEMESVSDFWTAIDVAFDDDADLQTIRQFNTYTPERFTHYAPMMYRCQGPTHIETSYSFYSQLYTVYAGVPEGKLGAYIGYTNASCYQATLVQDEPYSWPEAGRW